MVSLYLHHIECYMFFCNGCVSSPCVLYPTQSRWFSWSRLFSLPNGKWVGSLINESPGFWIYPMYNSCKGGRVGCGRAVCQGNSYHSREEHPGHCGFGSLELFGTLVFIGFELPPPLAVLSFSQFLHVEARFAKVLAYDARQMQRGNPIGLHLPCPDGTQIL